MFDLLLLWLLDTSKYLRLPELSSFRAFDTLGYPRYSYAIYQEICYLSYFITSSMFEYYYNVNKYSK